MSIPTSISNDGFASPMSSIYVKGKRKSLQAKIPEAVIVDTKVVKESPARFIYSGIGDLVSNITAIYELDNRNKRIFYSLFPVIFEN